MYSEFNPRIIKYLWLPVILLQFILTTQAQDKTPIGQSEEKLKQLFSEITSSSDDEERNVLGDTFTGLFKKVLRDKGSFEYTFSQLPNISALTTPDQRCRIYTWNVPLHSGTNRFYGLIQFRTPVNDSVRIIDLSDKGSEIHDPENEILSSERWYGAIYYQIIANQVSNGETFYTLLGWRGENMLVTIKLIEILTVTPEGGIIFGKPLFCQFRETNPARILFRHSATITMSLRYEEQRIVADKVWNAKRRKFEVTSEKTFLIIADRLVTSNPQLEGQYEYYIPSGDIIDGFLFRNSCWNFLEQVDARNPTGK